MTVLEQYWPFLLRGVVVTLEASALATALALAVGIVVGTARVYGGHITNAILGFFVDVLRAIPILILVFGAFYILPITTGNNVSPLVAGIISLGAFYGACISECIRGGIESIDAGQELAGRALGLTRPRVMMHIILPQGLIRMIPPVTSQVVSLVKNTSLLYIIAVPELMEQAESLNTQIHEPIAIFTIIGVVYFILVYPITVASEYLYRRIHTRAAG